MTARKLGIAIQEWILQEVVGESVNRSARIEELLIKGGMYEKEKAFKNTQNSESVRFGHNFWVQGVERSGLMV